MKVSVIGSGYVGLVGGACFADTGNDVICMDKDELKIENLKNGIIPIYEPGLKDIVLRNLQEERLSFTTNIKKTVEDSLVIFIAVGTPEDEDGSCDISHVLAVAKDISKNMNGYKIIVNKSTVPVGTADKVRELVRKNTIHEFDVVSNPEFLKEGDAINDFLKPDRVVIGTDNVRCAEIMKELYAPYVRTKNPMIIMDNKSAELTKYAANSMLATKISFINEIAKLCDVVGADVSMVREGIGADSRIGQRFIFPGVGYGGSCFPKDVKALIKTADELGSEMTILKTVEEVNNAQKTIMLPKILEHFNGDIKGKTFAIWGLSFKPETDDIREAPAIEIINKLLENQALVKAYDPQASHNMSKIFEGRVSFVEKSYKALEGADALILVTEWKQFSNPDFEKIKSLLTNPVIFDGRNQYNPKELKALGFSYFSIGRPNV
ncbi:MAG: UDP-glucose/GDP-mannose dehydrogenase family protein [Pseudomonadota bacterium]